MSFAEGVAQDPPWPVDELAAQHEEIPEGFTACGYVEPGTGHMCPEYFETPAKAGVHRWNAHKVRGSKKKGKAKAEGTSNDRVPPTIQFNLGGDGKGGKDPALDQVEKRAQQFITTAASLCLLVGLREDAADLAHGSEEWAHAVREVAEYEEWLRKLAAGGETTGRAIAWFNLSLATAALAVGPLLRHGVLPAGLADMAREAFGVAQAEGDASAATA